MKKIAFTLLTTALLVPGDGAARTERQDGVEGICGTRVSTTAIAYARHRFNRERLARQRADRLAVGQPGVQQAFKVSKQKNIAVIEDDGTLFRPPNLFDLERRGVQFKTGGARTRAERLFAGVSGDRGNRIEIGDDDHREIALPFSFSFYGTSYDTVYLNSDGNLTFTRPESSSLARSLGRFLEGPPRIAVDFVDLDPSVTSGEAGVYLLVRSDLVRVTWLDVPEWGSQNRNTLQLTLYPNGRITMAFGNVDAQEGVVGVSPGGPGTVKLVDLSQQLPVAPRSDAIAEQFSSVSEIDDLAVARAVLSTVRDEYDVIVLFADFDVDLGSAFAYNAPVKNEILGIGDGIYDISSVYGSDGRLRAFVQMGSLANYPNAPNNNILGSEATGIGVLAHEVGHRWLAFPTFIDERGKRSEDLLGRQLAHWSFNKDTDGSVMEGNDIRDNGDGTFTTVGSWMGFSPLDEYLMGLRRPDQVAPFFYVAGSERDNAAAPDTAVTLEGQRVDVTIEQVIAAVGPRVPAATLGATQVAFALLGRQGEPPSLASVKKVNQYRNRLSTFYRQETEERGRIASWLRLKKPAAAARAVAPGQEPAAEAAAPPAAATLDGDATLEPATVSRELRRRFERIADLTRR